MLKPEILFLKQEDVIKSGLLDMNKIIASTDNTFKLLGEGKVIQPTKIFLGMPNNEKWTSYGMSMPAYVGGEEDVVGFKWAAESVYNSTQPNMPYGIDVVILSNPKTMYPKAILDGTITTAMRTSACAGVMAKYNARNNSKIATLIGAGVIGRTMIMSISSVLPHLQEIRIVDLDFDKAQNLSNEFKDKLNIVPFKDVKSSIENSDLVVTETTSRKDFIKKEWLKVNATVIQMEMHSFEEKVLLSADKVILDSWEQMTHLAGHQLEMLKNTGKLKKEDVIELQDISAGLKKGRTREEQFVFCGSAGMGSVDIAIANMLYKNAKELNIGQKLMLWDNPLWV